MTNRGLLNLWFSNLPQFSDCGVDERPELGQRSVIHMGKVWMSIIRPKPRTKITISLDAD